MVLREMEKPVLRDKVYYTFDQMTSICRLRANPERERQGGIVPPPLRSWPLGRRSGRVATAPYPPPKLSSIVVPPNDSGNDPAGDFSLIPTGFRRNPLSYRRLAMTLALRSGHGSKTPVFG